MAELKDNQLLLLCNLIYLDGVLSEEGNNGEYTVATAVKKMLGIRLEELCAESNPAEMTKEEWEQILNNIKNDPVLMKLRITDVVDDYIKQPLGGMRVACFVDEDNNVTVVFRGTGGPMEWHDNGMGGYLSDTPQQETALSYVEGLTKKYNNITVTGHSKGGNKAQYVAIMCDEVDRCVSFDGQGFSREFFDAHPDEITRNSHKITRIADKWDFVNCLLFPGVKTKYIDAGYVHRITEFMHNHCPNTMLDENGKLRDEVKDPSILTKLISSYTQYINEHLKGEERQKAIDGLLSVFEKGQQAEGEDIKAALAIMGDRADDFLLHELNIAKEDLYAFLDDAGNDMEHMGSDLLGLIKERLGDRAGYMKNLSNDVSELLKDLIDDPFDRVQTSKEIAVFTIERMLRNAAFGKDFVTDLGEYLKDSVPDAIAAAQRVGVYIKEKVISGMDTVQDLSELKQYLKTAIYKELIDRAVNFLAQIGKAAKAGISKLISAARAEIKEKYDDFKAGVGYMKDLAKDALEKAADKGEEFLKGIGRKVLRGMGMHSTARISVDLLRLSELQRKIRGMERYFEERVHMILSDADRVTSSAASHYSEYYVQRQIYSINRTCEDIRESSRRVCDAFERKADALMYALGQYKQVESMLCGEITA